MSSATVKDVPAPVFIQALAAHFKKSGKFELPVWSVQTLATALFEYKSEQQWSQKTLRQQCVAPLTPSPRHWRVKF